MKLRYLFMKKMLAVLALPVIWGGKGVGLPVYRVQWIVEISQTVAGVALKLVEDRSVIVRLKLPETLFSAGDDRSEDSP